MVNVALTGPNGVDAVGVNVIGSSIPVRVRRRGGTATTVLTAKAGSPAVLATFDTSGWQEPWFRNLQHETVLSTTTDVAEVAAGFQSRGDVRRRNGCREADLHDSLRASLLIRNRAECAP